MSAEDMRLCKRWPDCNADIGDDGTCPVCGDKLDGPAPRPWTPERRERVGRAAWEARRAWALKQSRRVLKTWGQLSEAQRESLRCQGEAAVRADEGER